MKVEACSVPERSLLDRRSVADASFKDAWHAPLARPSAQVTEIFEAVFGHRPPWMKWAMIARNRAAAMFGLETPSDAEVMTPAFRGAYAVGDKIGAWPIFALSETELVAGRDNSHLDFRLSVMKAGDCVVFSTICNVHNGFGKVYMLCIAPFHRWGMRKLIANAIAAGRM